MATFRARDRSSAVLRSSRSEVWAALTDAELIAQITPYVTSIDVDGDRATSRNYVFTQMITLGDGDESILSDGGFYDSTFVRTEDGWRLQSYVASLVWLDGQWPEGVPRPGWWGVSSDRFGNGAA